MHLHETREDVAKREIGHTAVSLWIAWMLLGVFGVLAVAVPLTQTFLDLRAGRRVAVIAGLQDAAWRAREAWRTAAPGGRWHALLAANRTLLKDINAVDDYVQDTLFLTRVLQPPVQAWAWRHLRLGSEQVYAGRQGWLFYRADMDYVIGAPFLDPSWMRRRSDPGDPARAHIHPDPLPAIQDFAGQLRARGISLVLMPVPVKPVIHPEQFGPRRLMAAAPLQNRSFDVFITRLADAGITVFDPAPLLARRARETGQPQYLARDTHWTPDAMAYIAQALAEQLRRSEAGPALDAVPPKAYSRGHQEITAPGDTLQMLGLPESRVQRHVETVVIRPVLEEDGTPWRRVPEAPVLLLGDSFSNIYALDGLGWGAGAGLAEQLAYALRRPVDAILRNDAGAYASREQLAHALRAGNRQLDEVRVVVWQFATRELTAGDWRPVPLPSPAATPAGVTDGVYVPEPGTAVQVSGTVVAVSFAPRPGTVPYADHILMVHLKDLESDVPDARGREALIYTWSMRQHIRTAAATWAPGRRVTLMLRSWADMGTAYEGFNRSELDDPRWLIEEPCWAETEEP